MHLRAWHKILLVVIAFGVAIIGFMVKLPSYFSGHDKELHTVFYFLAAAFLNILFAKRNILLHAIIFLLLYGFGITIEYAQQYSNTYFHSRIHGNADPEDVYANLLGLLAFSGVWFLYIIIFFIAAVIKKEKTTG